MLEVGKQGVVIQVVMLLKARKPERNCSIEGMRHRQEISQEQNRAFAPHFQPPVLAMMHTTWAGASVNTWRSGFSSVAQRTTAFADQLDERERWDLASYLASLSAGQADTGKPFALALSWPARRRPRLPPPVAT